MQANEVGMEDKREGRMGVGEEAQLPPHWFVYVKDRYIKGGVQGSAAPRPDLGGYRSTTVATSD